MGLSEDGYHWLLRRLQGSGYTTDENSARDNELGAVARIAARAAEGLETVSRNMILATVDEALDQLERVRFFVGSAALSIEQRRERLLAFARASHQAVQARLDAAFGGVGETLLSDAYTLMPHRASGLGALVVGRRQPEAGPSVEAAVRRDLDPVLERGLPSRALSGGVTRHDLQYGMDLNTSGASIKVIANQNITPQTKARAAPLEIYPAVRLTSALWIELQAMLLWKSHGVSIDQTKQGRTIALRLSLGAGASATDSSIVWGGRLVSAWGVSRSSASDDLTTATAAEHVWLGAARLGAAGDATTYPLVGLDGSASGLTVGVNGAGALVVNNGAGASRSVTLFVRSTPPLSVDGTADTQPWGFIDQIVYTELQELYRATLVSGLGTPNVFGGMPAGALRRVVYTGGLSRPAEGASSLTSALFRVVLDTSEDYRDRLVLVVPMTTTKPDAIPTANADGLGARSGRALAPRLFYTGASGSSASVSTVTPYQHPDALDAPSIWLYADAQGQLIAEMKSTSAEAAACLCALIVASETFSGTSRVRAVPIDTVMLQTLDLEQPQNCGVYAQGFQGGASRYFLTDAAPKRAPTSPPLGLIAEGAPPSRPVSFSVRERLGDRADGTVEVRQKIVGQRRRVVVLTLSPQSATPVDDFNLPTELALGTNDQMDFRDRFVWVEGRYGAASPETPFLALLYTGPVGDVEVEVTEGLSLVFEMSRREGGYHSRLLFRSALGSELFVHATIETSGFLGLTDLRQYGVVNAFEYASDDAVEQDETRGYSDDFQVTGGPYIDV